MRRLLTPLLGLLVWSASSSVLAVDPIAYFQLDEFSLNGTAGEVVDAKGNFTDAHALGAADGVAPNAEGKVCYGVDIPDNSGTAVRGIDTGIDVDSAIGDSGAISFWYRSNRSWSGNGDHVLFDGSTTASSGKFFYLILKDDARLRFGIEDSNDNDRILQTASLRRGAKNWTHIVMAWDMRTETYSLWVDGVATPLSMIEEQNSRPTRRIGNMGRLTFGDTQSSYHYGGSDHSADGRFDEIRVYDRVIENAQVESDRLATHVCLPPPSVASDLFNCVEPGGDPVSGHLYTKVAAGSFALDVFSLRDSDGDGVADSRNFGYPGGRSRTVTLELVDTASGADCATYPALASTTQALTFNSRDSGKVTSAPFMVSRAYRSVACRVTDANESPPVMACSADRFAVRPAAIGLDPLILNNGGSGGTPVAVAGSAFELSITALAGYDGTPHFSSSPIEAHAGAVRSGTLSGSFSAADPATGQASGNSFSYDEVGNFRFAARAIRDTSFTAVDQTGDCIDNSYSNVPDASGRIGCDFGNSTETAWVGRFIPDHFQLSTLDDGSLAPNCSAGGFSYAGETIGYAINPELLVTAHKLGGGVTQNYSGDYMKLLPGSFNIPLLTADAGNMGADGVTPVELTMTVGSRTLSDHANGTVSLSLHGDSYEYSRSAANRVAPFISAIGLQATSVTDSDGVSAASSHTLSPAGMQILHGRLALANAHGSELQTLPVGMRAEHFAGPSIGYVANSLDTCTSAVPVTITDMIAGDGLLPVETCVWDAAGYSGSSCSTPGDASLQYLAVPASGQFNLNLKGPGLGNTGQLALSVDAPDWLEFNWSGIVDEDPSAIVTFGVHNRPGNVIFMRQVR